MREVNAAADLVGHLVLGAEDVGIVLSESANACHAAEFARLLVAIHRAEFGQAHGQLAITARLALVNHDVVRAVHRLEEVFLLVGHHDRLELAVGVIGIVAGDLVQLNAADVRRIDRHVAAADQLLFDERLEQPADHGALRQPENQAAADKRACCEQLQLLAEHAMVAALGLFDRL